MRRILLVLTFACAVAGCGPETSAQVDVSAPAASEIDARYAEVPGERFPIEPLDSEKIAPRLRRQEVDYVTTEAPGTIVVDPDEHYLYLVEPGGRARRYGVAVGHEGASWSGTATIKLKQDWPDWYPTAEMLDRRPDIKAMLTPLQSGAGIAGGTDNPIGARGMYLWQANKDTLYRIHGTTEPYSIGSSVSSGCIRMTNQDVIDLYSRVSVGTVVKVLPTSRPARPPEAAAASSG